MLLPLLQKAAERGSSEKDEGKYLLFYVVPGFVSDADIMGKMKITENHWTFMVSWPIVIVVHGFFALNNSSSSALNGQIKKHPRKVQLTAKHSDRRAAKKPTVYRN